MEITPVATYNCDIGGKFGLPRQAGLAPSLKGTVTMLPPYDTPDALRGLEGFDYIWLLWGFSLNGKSNGVTVRPPRLGGNERVGVFASRSPFRPNGIGLSCVKIEKADFERLVITVSGADLADGTPIYDIKPYVRYADSRPEARCGFVDNMPWEGLDVVWEDFSMRDSALEEILRQDPRPAYQENPDRTYGLSYKGKDIRFKVEDGVLTVLA